MGKAAPLALIIAAFIAGAAPRRDFRPGKLLEISADERVVDRDSIRRAIFVVQIADVIYTARGDRIRAPSGDMGQGLIVGDPVQAAIDGGNLILVKPDGKEMRTTIIMRTRAPNQ